MNRLSERRKRRPGNERCPHCGKGADAYEYLGDGDAAPEPDDISVCAYCRKISLFGADTNLCKPTAEELCTILTDHPELRRLNQGATG